MSMPAPPGFLSPAAFPFPGIQFPANDVPVPGAPYFVARGQAAAAATTITIHVQNPTGASDAIVVAATTGNSSGNPPVSVTDTQGNAYALQRFIAAGESACMYAAFNTVPLTAADTITVTLSQVNNPQGVVVAGCPSTSLTGVPGVWLSSVMAAGGGTAAPSVNKITAPFAIPASPAQPVLLVVADTGALQPFSGTPPEVFPQGWSVVGQLASPIGSASRMCIRVKVVTAPITSGQLLVSVQTAAGGNSLILAALIPETRFAPARPFPDMPPGLQSPGAWQYAPLTAPEGPWSTRYNPGPNKWAETLPAVSVTAPAMVRTTGKTLAATPVAHGALTRAAAHLRTLAAAPHVAAALARSTGKRLAAAAHPAGKLARTTGKTLTATPRAAAFLARGSAKRLAARVTAIARLTAYGPAPSFTLGVPQLEWNVSISAIGISQLSTEYVPVPVAATKSGLPYNPTADIVQFAFMPTATQVPQSGDWIASSWETISTSIIYPYNARCLVGPAGSVALGIGTYIIYVRITDNPTVPVLIAGQLQVS